jgi:hypothetical protein
MSQVSKSEVNGSQEATGVPTAPDETSSSLETGTESSQTVGTDSGEVVRKRAMLFISDASGGSGNMLEMCVLLCGVRLCCLSAGIFGLVRKTRGHLHCRTILQSDSYMAWNLENSAR